MYSRKCFIGGLPHGITRSKLRHCFSSVGPVDDIFWPNAGYATRVPPKGYAFVVFRHKKSVDDLLKRTIKVADDYFFQLAFEGKAFTVQIKVWKLCDVVYKRVPYCGEYSLGVFIGGVRSGVTAFKLASELEKRFGPVSYVRLSTCSLGYPNGTGLIRFCDERGFQAAISSDRFPVANKPCETKLYVSPDMVCNQCPLSPSFVCRFCKAILCSFCYASIRHRHYEKFDLRLAP
ncbi:RNA recognition motif. (a.k.a. RRM, RBD, or RNP domain) [Nesidiocoris tenuis]|uniref:RNA recognition motif. (A.k.a. RRM, RBD, or RNP domain) n=1 Tax=Nesidiocoris tenuis TaxID=355587 RepID=A0ABN7AJM0_9HEMI|nr:RNA recognition motif. (a.k.a. RRM, RBD, or RNP domain) [Nesidiocoris tenuis]